MYVSVHIRNSIKTADGMFYTSAIYAYMLASNNPRTHTLYIMRVVVCVTGELSIADMMERTLPSQAGKKYAIQSICYPPTTFERRYAVAVERLCFALFPLRIYLFMQYILKFMRMFVVVSVYISK